MSAPCSRPPALRHGASLSGMVVCFSWVLLVVHLSVVGVLEGAITDLIPWNATCPQRCTCSYRTGDGLVPARSVYRTTDCSNRKLHAIPSVPTNTEVLLLRGNGITASRLPPLFQLKMADISHNNIEGFTLQPHFQNLTSLQVLNFAYNRIRSLMHETFMRLPHLRELQLSNNEIQSIEDHSFDGLGRLEVLDLSDNKLVSVSQHWFDALPSLRDLKLDENQITTLNNAPFQPLQRLTQLSLLGNHLEKLPKSTFRGLGSLQNLNMKYNRFEKVPSRSFTIFKRLKLLSLDGNPLSSLADGDFRDFSVSEISLSFMPDLSIVDKDAFVSLPGLVTLQMHDNVELSYIDEEAFVRVPHLKELYVHNNNLIALPPSLPVALPELHLLSYTNNPMVCDCNAHWLKMANLTQTNHSGVMLADADRLKCDAPSELSGRYLRDILIDDLAVSCPPTVVPFFNVSYQRELGDDVVYECRAVGVTTPHVHWILSNGKAVNNTSNFSRVRLSPKGSLQIQHIKPADAGTYTCVATNDNGYDTLSTVLLIHSKHIHVLIKGVATNFVTLTWNGTDSTMSTSDYLLLYRRQGANEVDYGRVYLKSYMRAYTITNLLPQTIYEFCIAYEHMQQVVKLHCVDIETKHRMYMMEGIKTLGNMTVVVALTVTVTTIAFFCLGVTAVKRYRRRKAYKEPEGVTLAQPYSGGSSTASNSTNSTNTKVGHMSQIPLDNLYHPPSTPICTSRTSLIGHASA